MTIHTVSTGLPVDEVPPVVEPVQTIARLLGSAMTVAAMAAALSIVPNGGSHAAMTNDPSFPASVNTTAPVSLTSAAPSNTLISGGASGTVFNGANCASTDAARTVTVYRTSGGVDFQWFQVSIAASAGNDPTTPTPAQPLFGGQSFPLDQNGNQVIQIAPSESIKISGTSVASGKVINCHPQGRWDY